MIGRRPAPSCWFCPHRLHCPPAIAVYGAALRSPSAWFLASLRLVAPFRPLSDPLHVSFAARRLRLVSGRPGPDEADRALSVFCSVGRAGPVRRTVR